MSTDGSAAAGRPTLAPGRARSALLILTAVYGVNYVDRQIVGILVEPIKRELHVSDAGLGLLTGFAFALFYGGLAVPIAWLAERVGGRRVIAASIALFSLATVLSAVVVDYTQLLLARVVVGIGEAGTLPASLAIIAGLYPAERRAGAMATYTVGAQVGVLVGFAVAPWVAAVYGWRAGFLVAGLPGLVLAALAWRYTPDDATARRGPRTGPMRPSPLLSNRQFWLSILSGGAALFLLNAMVSWTPAYLIRAFGLSVRAVGLVFGIGVGVFAAGTTWLSGRLADRLHNRSDRGALRMGAAASGLCAALMLATLWAPRAGWAITLLIPALALAAVHQGPLLARVQSMASPAERPMATAIYAFITTLLGLGLGPLFVGVLSDRLGHGSAAGLRVALSCSLAAGPLAAVFLYRLSSTLDGFPAGAPNAGDAIR